MKTKYFIIIGIVVWLVLCLLGIDTFLNLYEIRFYDKFLHFLAGVVVTIALISFKWNKQNIVIFNVVSAILWEFGQLATREMFGLVNVGFPDGYWDILAHLVGMSLIFYVKPKYLEKVRNAWD
jgi:hypothetical protein